MNINEVTLTVGIFAVCSLYIALRHLWQDYKDWRDNRP